MADPHNKKRYGETWDLSEIVCYLGELQTLKDLVIFSGGWAWHFMSPVGHIEYKHAHDHKDVDIFVFPQNITAVIHKLTEQGFIRVATRFDKLPNNSGFRRYEKTKNGKKLIVDFFVGRDIQVRDIYGWQVVDPRQLLTFYKTIHSSDNCFAVKAAADLLKYGIDPVGREELVKIPEEL
jgi:hypothetical protein